MSLYRLLSLMGILVAATAAAVAQPRSARDGTQASLRFSHTMEAALENVAGGEFSLSSLEFGVRGASAISATTQLLYGVSVAHHELDLRGPSVLPTRLQSVGLPLGLMQRVDDKWRWSAMVQPRYAGAPNLGDGGFDVPVLAFANYLASPDLTWTFGLRYSARSSIEVLPIIGLTWKFAPEWEAKVAFPESGVYFRPSSALTVGGIVELHGGDFRIDRDPRPVGSRPGGSLDRSWLEYREIRGGLSAQYDLSSGVSLRADAGYAFSQRFEYERLDWEIDGEGAPFFAVSLVARF